MPLADWGKVLFPHLVFKENVTAPAVDYMKNQHIIVQNGGRKMPVNAAGPIGRPENLDSALLWTKLFNFYLVKLIYSREKILR